MTSVSSCCGPIGALLAEGGTPTAPVIDRYGEHFLPESAEVARDGDVTITFLGTTSLLFDDGETQLLVDGFFSRPSLAAVVGGPIAADTAVVDAVLTRAGVERPAAVLVAHSHWDHALDAPYIAARSGARLYGSESTLNIGRGWGLPEERLARFEPGRALAFGAFVVTVLPSKHSPPTPGVNDDLGLVIDEPLRQPAPVGAFVEGGSFDFLVEHGGRAVLVKPSANWVDGALDGVRADVLFLGTATLGNQDAAFRATFYEQTVGTVRPDLVVPVHWDNFFAPLGEHLDVLDPADIPAGFDFLIERLTADGIAFGIMQGYQRTVLPAG